MILKMEDQQSKCQVMHKHAGDEISKMSGYYK
jgi:hypothetical protein